MILAIVILGVISSIIFAIIVHKVELYKWAHAIGWDAEELAKPWIDYKNGLTDSIDVYEYRYDDNKFMLSLVINHTLHYYGIDKETVNIVYSEYGYGIKAHITRKNKDTK